MRRRNEGKDSDGSTTDSYEEDDDRAQSDVERDTKEWRRYYRRKGRRIEAFRRDMEGYRRIKEPKWQKLRAERLAEFQERKEARSKQIHERLAAVRRRRAEYLAEMEEEDAGEEES